MFDRFPGTVIECKRLKKGDSQRLFDGIFAAGGITLSQMSVMTGVEPYTIQNWVKRRFISSPQNRLYSPKQFAGVAIINMLRKTMQLDDICHMMLLLDGDVESDEDDIIKSDRLYHIYTDMLCDIDAHPEVRLIDYAAIRSVAKAAAQTVCRQSPARTCEGREIAGALHDSELLSKVLQMMLYAHMAASLGETAERIFSHIK